jgi:hypothetical protein
MGDRYSLVADSTGTSIVTLVGRATRASIEQIHRRRYPGRCVYSPAGAFFPADVSGYGPTPKNAAGGRL